MPQPCRVCLVFVLASLILVSGTARGQGKLFSYNTPIMRGRITSDGVASVPGAMVLAFWSGTQEVPILNVDTLHVEEVITDAAGRFTLPAWTANDLRSPVRSARPRVYAYAVRHEWVFVDFEKERSSEIETRLPLFRGDEGRWADRSKQLVGQLVLVAAPLSGARAPFRLVEALEQEWQRMPPEWRTPPSLIQAFAPAVEEMRVAYAQWVLQSQGQK